jgi:hypothetical protein
MMTAFPELAGWDGFYVIVGSAAGALIGLQFVVISLIAQRPVPGTSEAGPVFSSPTVMHFGAVLLLSALLHAPWSAIETISVLWGVMGAAGFLYTLRTFQRIRRQKVYRPAGEDWIFHVVTPLIGYAILAWSSIAARSNPGNALFAVGAAALVLLFTGIHNAWDAAAYHVLTPKRSTEGHNSQRNS